MITLHQGFAPRAGGQGIWIALCLTVLVLALAGSVRVLQTQERLLEPRRAQESPPQAAAVMPGENRSDSSCADLLGQDSAGWTAGQTAVPAVFVVQPGTEAMSIWLGQEEHGTGSSDSSYSSVWQEVSLPAHATSLTLTWSWRLQTSEEPAAAPSAVSDRQQALLLDAEGELLEVMHSARTQATRVAEQRHDLSPYAGDTVRIYFNAYNDGNSQPTSLRLDHWALMSCQAAAAPPGIAEEAMNARSVPPEFAGWGPAAQGFSLWALSILAFVALAGVGLAENARSRTHSRR